MPCLLICGDTGMGKTKIVRKFEGSEQEQCEIAR
ncbi:TniB family NTP-binding protein [Mesorhizobium sp. M4A.F.Ca.ET.050.02.1.1]|nr:TniB family NTP-binding protein [Mesorhizobium sp. M4A.F.Ca.ET.050.02.1.1]